MFCGDFVNCECFQNKVLVYEKVAKYSGVAGEVRWPPATFENPAILIHRENKQKTLGIGTLVNITIKYITM